VEPPVVATSRRVVHASLERVWENVLDWEHLPWLHRETFASVALVARRRDGFRVRTAVRSRRQTPEFEIDVAVDRGRLCYHSRTVTGPAAGTDIFTRLEPVDAHATGVVVEFHVPDVAPDQIPAVGAFYTRMYERLWDQDEAMMGRRQAVLDAPTAPVRSPAPLPLGPVDSLRARLPLVVDYGGRPFRLVDVGGSVAVHAAVCPHLGGPLDEVPVHDGCITCPWHGYRFDLRTGASAGSRGLRLDPAPRLVVADDGQCTLTLVATAA
jgi:nitrite reductase/ring-hydroxylating ferredoxin subunit